jgi:hypothetical protein
MGTCLDEIKFVFNVFFVLVEKSADMVFLHIMANPQCECWEDTVKGRWRFSSAGDQTVVGFKLNIFLGTIFPKLQECFNFQRDKMACFMKWL